MICEVIQPFNYQNLKRNTKLKFTNFAKKLDCFVAKPFALRNDMKRKFAFTLAEGATHIAKSAAPRRAAFTLAEVLITLGIIGVVAAMTLPTLIQNHRKHEVETKLAKIYSVVNQAIKLSTVEYGEPQYWADWDCGTSGTPTCSTDEAIEKFNKYIGKNLKILKIDKDDDSKIFYVYLADGGILGVRTYLYDIYYYISKNAITNNINNYKWGVNVFAFRFSPKFPTNQDSNDARWANTINPTFEPHSFAWDGTIEKLTDTTNKYACGGTLGSLCTKLIQLNGWKIPKDYPLKF